MCGTGARHKAQRGFTLIEALVALLILSIGVLGVAGMQVSSLQVERESRLQATGVRMARELAELMRANPRIAELTTASGNPYLGNHTSVTAAPPTDCLAASCADRKELSQWEVHDWLARLVAELPGARAQICFDASPYDSNGLAEWNCSNDGSTAVIKIGWTRGGTRSGGGVAALDLAARPSVVVPVVPGG